MRLHTWMIALIGTGLLLAVIPQLAQAESEETGSPHDAASAFDQVMLDLYQAGQDRLLAETRPLLVVDDNNLTLITDNGRKVVRYIPDLYEDLKSLSHVILGVLGAVTPWPKDDAAMDRLIKDFEAIKTAMETVEPRISQMNLDPTQIAEMKQVLTAARSLVDTTLSKRDLTPEAVADFVNSTRIAWLAAARVAEDAKLRNLHKAVTELQQTVPEGAWRDHLVVAVEGASFVKVNNVVIQYFQRVMPDAFAMGRVIYAENIDSTDTAVDHVGDVLMQERIGQWTFSAPDRMRENFLGYDAGTILDEILPGSPPAEQER